MINQYYSVVPFTFGRYLKKSITLLTLLMSMTLITGCGSDSSDTTTFDGVILLQPQLLKDASPDVRSNLARKVSYGIESEGEPTLSPASESGGVQTTASDISIDVITRDDLTTALLPGTRYSVRIQWDYQSGSSDPIPLGSATYQFNTDTAGNPEEEAGLDSAPSLESYDYNGGSDPDDVDGDGFSNLAELNSLDVDAVGDPDKPVMGGVAGNAEAIEVIIASSETIDYDSELPEIWGTSGRILFTAKSLEFEGTTWTAVRKEDDVFMQIINTDSSKSPFENKIQISFEDESNNSPVPVEFSNAVTVKPEEVEDFGTEGVLYAYRLNGLKIDYRQFFTTPIDTTPFRMLNIQFFDSEDSLTASWSGKVAFAGGTVSVDPVKSEVSLSVLNDSGDSADPQPAGGWAECTTSFQVVAQFTPELPSDAMVTYSWSSNPETAAPFDDVDSINFPLPARMDMMNFVLSLDVTVTPQDGSDSYQISVMEDILYSGANSGSC